MLRRALDDPVVEPATNGCKALTGWLNETFSGQRTGCAFGVTRRDIHIDNLLGEKDAIAAHHPDRW